MCGLRRPNTLKYLVLHRTRGDGSSFAPAIRWRREDEENSPHQNTLTIVALSASALLLGACIGLEPDQRLDYEENGPFAPPSVPEFDCPYEHGEGEGDGCRE